MDHMSVDDDDEKMHTEDMPSKSPVSIDVSEGSKSPTLHPSSPFFSHRTICPGGSIGVPVPVPVPAAMEDDEVRSQKLNEWREIEYTGEEPPPMSGLTAARFERTMLVFGGYNNGEALDGLFGLNLDTGVWQKIETVGSGPCARTSHSMVVDHDSAKLYVCCGSGSTFGHSNFGDWYELDLRLRFWRQLHFSGDEMRPRYGQTVVCYSGKLYMFGGTFGREFSREFFILDVETQVCCKVRLVGAVPSPRYKHSAGIFDGNKMLVFGGAELQNYKLNDAYYVNLDTYRWTKLRCGGDVPRGRFAHSMVVHNDMAYLFGGTDRTSCRSDLYVLDIATCTWKEVHCSGSVPRGRYFHGTIFDDKRGEMLIWGGKGSTTAQVRFNDLHAVALTNAMDRPDYMCSLARDLYDLLNAEDLCDLKLISLDGHSLAAHQLVVRARCPALMMQLQYSLWVGPNGDGNGQGVDDFSIVSDDDGHGAIVSLAYSLTVLRLLLRFIYTDEIEVNRNIDYFDYLDTMICGHELQLDRLVVLCEQQIRNNINITLAVECLARLKDKMARLESLERFLLQYTHVQLAHAHGPGVPIDALEAGEPTLPSEIDPKEAPTADSSGRTRSPTRFVLQRLRIPRRRLHQDMLRLRQMMPGQAEAESMPFDVRFQFGRSRSRVFAHLVILAARSAYFGSYSFRKGMMEANSGLCRFPGPNKAVLSQPAFEAFLDYIYGGEVVLSSMPVEALQDFLNADASNYFGLRTKQLERFAKQYRHRVTQPSSPLKKPVAGCLVS